MVSCVITYDRVHCILFENIIKSLVHDSRVASQCYSTCCFPLLHRTRIAWLSSINLVLQRDTTIQWQIKWMGLRGYLYSAVMFSPSWVPHHIWNYLGCLLTVLRYLLTPPQLETVQERSCWHRLFQLRVWLGWCSVLHRLVLLLMTFWCSLVSYLWTIRSACCGGRCWWPLLSLGRFCTYRVYKDCCYYTWAPICVSIC